MLMNELVQPIRLAEPDLTGNEKKYVLDCLNSGWISSQGEYVSRFAEAFSQYIGTQYAVCTSNGTTALHLALAALGITSGDEVLVPDLTFGATANAVLHCGAKPVLVDVEPDTWGIDPEALLKSITPNTKAIIVVHLYGRPAAMDRIMDIARQYDLKVVEDCAESLGAELEGVKTGNIGDIGCFSFFANKVMTTGEGGMLTTNSKELAEKVQILRDHGMSKDKRYWHIYPGYNYRMTNIQAAIGLAQLERIDYFLAQRERIAQCYRQALKGIVGLSLHVQALNVKEVTWLFCVQIDSNITQVNRDVLLSYLNDNGVEARSFFYPLHQQPVFVSTGHFSQSILLAGSGLCLPTYANLNEAKIKYICELITNCLTRTNLNG